MQNFYKRIKDGYSKYSPLIVQIFLILGVIYSILLHIKPFSDFLKNEWLATTLLFVLFLLSDIILLIYKKVNSSKQKIYNNERHSNYFNDLEQVINNVSGTVYLLEFSSRSIHTLLNHLIKKKIKVQLLIAHPEIAPNEFQRNRIRSTIRDLMNLFDHAAQDKLEIRCYKQNPSLRGRLFGEGLLSVGWYTFGTKRLMDSQLKPELLEERKPQTIHGDTNPIINFDPNSEDGNSVKMMFLRVFDDLWETGIPLNDVIEEF
jgi:hypothetical protein